jgi:hypothetical protein
MKKLSYLLLVFVFVCAGASYAQDIHHQVKLSPDELVNDFAVESALFKIETAIQRGNMNSLESLLASTVTLRLEDSLYLNVSDIAALDLLKEYFKGIKLIKFSSSRRILQFEREDGARKSEYVDVVLGSDVNVVITAINMSNYPAMTAFCKFVKRTKR